jgi:hypothetical protein
MQDSAYPDQFNLQNHFQQDGRFSDGIGLPLVRMPMLVIDK